MRRFVWLFAFLCAPAVVSLIGCPPDSVEVPQRDSAVCAPFDFGLAPTSETAPDTNAPEDALDADAGDADVAIDAAPDTTIDDVAPPPSDAPKVCRSDVDSILFLSCAFSTCHGESPTGQKGLFIDKSGARDWVPFVVNAKSTERPDMVRVAPGDPAKSWLAHKIVGDQCAFHTLCVDGDCGDQMPATNQPLNDSDMNTILMWIRQGADPDPTCGGTK